MKKKVLTATTTIAFTVCLLIGIIFISLLEPHNLYTTYDVRVINGFTNNSSLPLVIWCSSGDSDLGGRALQEGDDFSWSLQTSSFFLLLSSSHDFLCTMKWEAKRKRFRAFNVPRDTRRCYFPFRKCSWLVKEDGFYFSSDEINWKKDFSWF